MLNISKYLRIAHKRFAHLFLNFDTQCSQRSAKSWTNVKWDSLANERRKGAGSRPEWEFLRGSLTSDGFMTLPDAAARMERLPNQRSPRDPSCTRRWTAAGRGNRAIIFLQEARCLTSQRVRREKAISRFTLAFHRERRRKLPPCGGSYISKVYYLFIKNDKKLKTYHV